MIEYLLLGGINDSPGQAQALVFLIHAYRDVSRLCVVNLITYNATGDSGDAFKVPSPAALRAFEEVLTHQGIAWTRRVSFGSDIGGACGQLAGELHCKA